MEVDSYGLFMILWHHSLDFVIFCLIFPLLPMLQCIGSQRQLCCLGTLTNCSVFLHHQSVALIFLVNTLSLKVYM